MYFSDVAKAQQPRLHKSLKLGSKRDKQLLSEDRFKADWLPLPDVSLRDVPAAAKCSTRPTSSGKLATSIFTSSASCAPSAVDNYTPETRQVPPTYGDDSLLLVEGGIWKQVHLGKCQVLCMFSIRYRTYIDRQDYYLHYRQVPYEAFTTCKSDNNKSTAAIVNCIDSTRLSRIIKYYFSHTQNLSMDSLPSSKGCQTIIGLQLTRDGLENIIAQTFQKL